MIAQFSDSSGIHHRRKCWQGKMDSNDSVLDCIDCFEGRSDSGKTMVRWEETNGASGFCDCDEVKRQSSDQRKKRNDSQVNSLIV